MDKNRVSISFLLAGVLLFIVTLVGLPFVFLSCGSTETEVFSVRGVPVTVSGPLLAGSNTAQGVCTPDFTSWLESKGKFASDVKEVRLTKASVSLPDSATHGLLSTVSLSFASDKYDMQTMGALNPFPAGSSRADIPPAQDQQYLKGILMEPSFMVVMDCNVAVDTLIELPLLADLEFSVLIRH